jgi:hypothetical protein
VIASPEDELATGVIQRIEDLFVQWLNTQTAVERLDEAILLRFTLIDIMPIDVVIARPLQCATRFHRY